jgi:rod shape-determining protein MreD
LQPWRWIGVPALISLALTIAFAAPLRIFGLAAPEPVFPVALAFAWALVRPSLLGPLVLLLLGLFQDLFWGGPMGLWAISFLLAYGLALLGRSLMVGQEIEVVGVWYLGSVLTAMSSAFVLTVLSSHTVPNLVSALWQTLATVVLFPAVQRILSEFRDADIRFR